MATTYTPIWTPSLERIAQANMTAFIGAAARLSGAVRDYDSLYAWSVTDPARFWSLLWDFLGIVGEKGDDIIGGGDKFADVRWFTGTRLNFAENHLRRRDDKVAIVARSESGLRRELTWRELYDLVSRARAALLRAGVGPTDRVAAVLPNFPETVVATLAATSLGAIWSICSPDYGLQAMVDRLSQIEPKVLFVCDGYQYAGKAIDLRERMAELAHALPSVERFVVVPVLAADAGVSGLPKAQTWHDFIAPHRASDIVFERFAFDHPVYILYSSGTTGKPKAIMHGAGGSLLQTAKEIALHFDARRDEPVFFPTTAGWVVWNILLGSLVGGSPIVLYDGSPTYPDVSAVLALIAQERAGIARIVPPVIDSYIRAELDPAKQFNFDALRCLVSGSAPLLPHHYEYVYRHIKSDLHLASPAGGTDVMTALASGNPIGPVYPGVIQCRSLGMSVEIFDEQGRSVVGQAGELVCTKPFPSVPLGFWGDPSRERLMQSYFSTYPNVWRHGDWAEITPEGGIVIYGRADATLNVKGVRIGSAEIYRGLEDFRKVQEAVAVVQRRGADERIVLFVVMANGAVLDEAMVGHIKQAIRASATVRHVPSKILAVPDLPRSLNGKPSEIAVRDVINRQPLSSKLGLINPEAVKHFAEIPELGDWT